MNMAQSLIKAARSFGERPALSVGTTTYADYAALAARAAALAGAFRDRLRLAPGDRVALAMHNCPQFMEVLYGAWHAGLAAVPINAKLHPREFAYILENSGARACFATAGLAETIAPLATEIDGLERVISVDSPDYQHLGRADPIAPAAVAPDDLAWLFYTSGTTGQPKGAMLTHGNLWVNNMNYYADIDYIDQRDCIIHGAPMSHGSGLYGLPHVAKGSNQVIPESHGYDPAETLDLVAHYPLVTMFLAPTMIVRLLANPALRDAAVGNLKSIVYGGGPMYVEDTLRAIDALGPCLVQIYGQGEAPMTITYLPKTTHSDTGHPRYMARLASVGIARTEVEVAVFDDRDRPLPPGETGEIVVRGNIVMAGYWQNPEATAKTLANGWLHTGDMGAFDADGFLTLKDRSKDMIISGGTNIYPREIEEVLVRHPAVLETAVIGRPHPDWGEEVIAFVVPRGDTAVSESELDRVCLDHIARFKRPREYRFVDALPKNNYGKVLKTELRKQLSVA